MSTKTHVIHVGHGGAKKKQKTDDQSTCGPGAELKKLFHRFGIDPKKGACSCNKHAREMDERGADWCEKNIDKIAGWIKHECKKRKLPFVRPVVVAAIRLAIARARKAEPSKKTD